MKRLLIMVALAIGFTANSWGQAIPPQVETLEVLRRGDSVTIAGEGPRAGEDDLFNEAMAPPPDDNHLWFITIWTTPNCPACEALKRDFVKAPELNAFIKQVPIVVDPMGKSELRAWAHFNVYSNTDQTQTWRRERYKIGSFPTMVIQPPRDKTFGDPRTVVMQEVGYDGNPAKMRDKIVKAVRLYSRKLNESNYRGQQGIISGPKASQKVDLSSGAGQRTPPFSTPPNVDPFNPLAGPQNPYPAYPPGYPYQPNPYPSFPPPETPPVAPKTPDPPAPAPNPAPAPVTLTGSWGALPIATFLGIGSVVLLLGVQVWQMDRERRIKAGKTPLLTDAQAAQLANFLTTLGNGGGFSTGGQNPRPLQ